MTPNDRSAASPEPTAKCRNTRHVHPCDPYYVRKYDGYCLDCANAGVDELQSELAAEKRIAELERVICQSVADWKAAGTSTCRTN